MRGLDIFSDDPAIGFGANQTDTYVKVGGRGSAASCPLCAGTSPLLRPRRRHRPSGRPLLRTGRCFMDPQSRTRVTCPRSATDTSRECCAGRVVSRAAAEANTAASTPASLPSQPHPPRHCPYPLTPHPPPHASTAAGLSRPGAPRTSAASSTARAARRPRRAYPHPSRSPSPTRL